jgi:signal peptidase I
MRRPKALQAIGIVCYCLIMEKNIYAISYRMKRELQHRIMTVACVIIVCMILLSLFMTFILFPVNTRSVSMNPELPTGSVEFVSPLFRIPDRGDLMLLNSQQKDHLTFSLRVIDVAAGFFTAQHFFPFTSTFRASGNQSIRRVAAVPGDTIYMENYILHVKPRGSDTYLSEFELSGMKYTAQIGNTPDGWDPELGSSAKMSEYTLGNDEYYVLGDNRVQCADSRLWGPVKASRFRGKVLLICFPFNHFKWFSDSN